MSLKTLFPHIKVCQSNVLLYETLIFFNRKNKKHSFKSFHVHIAEASNSLATRYKLHRQNNMIPFSNTSFFFPRQLLLKSAKFCLTVCTTLLSTYHPDQHSTFPLSTVGVKPQGVCFYSWLTIAINYFKVS